MAYKSKALSSFDALKVCIEVTLIIKGWYCSHLHWKLGLQFISKIKKGGELAGEVMNLTLQQRSWQGIPETKVFMELSFRTKQRVINLLKIFSNQTISSPNVRTKNSLANSIALWKKNLTPIHAIFFKNDAHLLFTQ